MLLLLLNAEDVGTLQVLLLIEEARVNERIKELEAGAEAIDPDELEDLQHDQEQIPKLLDRLSI